MNQEINRVYLKMIKYDSGDPRRIQHFTKVHSYCRLMGEQERLEEQTQKILEIAALTHDIGIKAAQEKYGKCDGKLQEQEGPEEARKLLEEAEIDPEVIDRVCWLIAHHHTYKKIQGIDYQILVEADFLVNLYEDQVSLETVDQTYCKIFRTELGKRLLRQMFGFGTKYVTTPQLETGRLLLVQLHPSDAEEAFRNWTSDPDVTHFMRYPLHRSVGITRKWLQEEEKNITSDTNFTFGFIQKDTGDLIGSGGLVFQPQEGVWELGYNIRKSCWNQGYTTEAAREILDYGINVQGIRHFSSMYAKENPASGRVLEKLGFVKTGESSYESLDGKKNFDCWTCQLEVPVR